MLKIIKEDKWLYPPIKTRHGIAKRPHDSKDIVHLESDLFPCPIIITSDLHAHAQPVWDRLETVVDLSKYVVICAGDMAGIKNIYGEDADPTATYKFIADRAKALYVIQGNHDLPPKNMADLLELKNADGTFCYLPDGKSIKTIDLGKIGGVHGIISDKIHPYKKSEEMYLKMLKKCLTNKPNILVTHDAPNIENYHCQESIYKMVKQFKPKIYIYGHCHHPFYHKFLGGTHYINVDARVLIIN